MNKKKILRGQPVALLFLSRLNLTLQSAEERINLDRLSIALDVIAKILLPNRSKNVDKLHLLKNAFRPIGEAAMAFEFKQCCTAKGQRFRYLNENHFRTYLRLV